MKRPLNEDQNKQFDLKTEWTAVVPEYKNYHVNQKFTSLLNIRKEDKKPTLGDWSASFHE